MVYLIACRAAAPDLVPMKTLMSPSIRQEAAVAGAPQITHEDIDRAHDRQRVLQARAGRGFFARTRLLWLLIGPGILVMLGENDGPSMVSYAATGARFGVGFFAPFFVLTFVMAIVVHVI